MKKYNLKYFLFITLFFVFDISAKSLELNLNSKHEFNKYSFLLEKPSSIVLTLINLDLANINSMDPIILGPNSFKISISGPLNKLIQIPLEISFIDKKDSIFLYEARVSSSLINTFFNFQVDTKFLNDDLIVIKLNSLDEEFFTDEVKEKLQNKLNFLFSVDTQEQILDYLNQGEISNIYEKIIVDALNKKKFLKLSTDNIDSSFQGSILRVITLLTFLFIANIFLLSFLFRFKIFFFNPLTFFLKNKIKLIKSYFFKR